MEPAGNFDPAEVVFAHCRPTWRRFLDRPPNMWVPRAVEEGEVGRKRSEPVGGPHRREQRRSVAVCKLVAVVKLGHTSCKRVRRGLEQSEKRSLSQTERPRLAPDCDRGFIFASIFWLVNSKFEKVEIT